MNAKTIKSALFHEISKPISNKKAEFFAHENADSVDEFFKQSAYSNYEVAFRAALILERVAETEPENLERHIDEFINVYRIVKNQSAQPRRRILIKLSKAKRKS